MYGKCPNWAVVIWQLVPMAHGVDGLTWRSTGRHQPASVSDLSVRHGLLHFERVVHGHSLDQAVMREAFNACEFGIFKAYSTQILGAPAQSAESPCFSGGWR